MRAEVWMTTGWSSAQILGLRHTGPEHGSIVRLRGHNLDVFIERFECTGHTFEGAAGAEAGNPLIDFVVAHVFDEFGCSGF